jgi:cytoskeleton protein RodZ
MKKYPNPRLAKTRNPRKRKPRKKSNPGDQKNSSLPGWTGQALFLAIINPMEDNGKTVGQQLKQARGKLGIRLEDAALATHIKLVYLQELEGDHPELLPSPASARGFLRLYAAYLKLPTAPLVELWDHPTPPTPAPLPETKTVEQTSPSEKAVPASLNGTEPVTIEQDEKSKPAETISPLSELHSTPDLGKKKRSRKKKGEASLSSETASTSNAMDSPAPIEAQKPIEDPTLQAEPQVPPPLPQKSSAELFVEIGRQLHDQRKLLGLSLGDIERFTHIKRNFIEALESGQFNQLPSSVQGRGMLNNYAAFLGIEEDSVMSTYAAALESQRQERLPPRKPEPVVTGGFRINIPERFRKYINPDLIFGSIVILAMFVFLLWSAVQVFTGSKASLTPTAPSVSEVLQLTPSLSPLPDLTLTAQAAANPVGTAVPGAGVPVAPSLPTPLATKDTAPVQVYIVALQRAYLQVTVDGKVVFDGRVTPGGAYTYSGQKSVVLLTGSAAALEVYFNQKFQGRLGEIGQVVKVTFTETGISTPVPTQTPLPTATPTPTRTPAVTPTK